MKAIETYYNGYKFRSRLEARWAVFFDSLKIPYLYEPEGFELKNGTRYLPDFYLPDSKQFFEVKGKMSDNDMEKIKSVINDGYSVVIGLDDGKFIACNHWLNSNDEHDEYSLCEEESWLCECYACGKYWFAGAFGLWDCQCCGSHDGDHLFNVCMSTDERNPNNGSELWDVARQARFEYGETPEVERLNFFPILDVEGNNIIIRPYEDGFTISHPQFTDFNDGCVLTKQMIEIFVQSIGGAKKYDEFIRWTRTRGN
jgi:hypothetical protein